jgi:cell division protein ZapA (FtsZ GTPase activity inhibitor)
VSKVTISLNGRPFTIGCEEGQQAYLRELASHLDSHVRGLAERVGQIGDLRLLLMAALIVADELKEAQGQRSCMAKICRTERAACRSAGAPPGGSRPRRRGDVARPRNWSSWSRTDSADAGSCGSGDEA